MEKLKISTDVGIVGGVFWLVITPTDVIPYETPEGAFEYVWKKLKRARKEASAFSMVNSIAVNLLSHRECELINKLKKNKCAGITPRQYGYLKGIHERQEREW